MRSLTEWKDHKMRRLIVGLYLALLATVGLLHLEAYFRPMAYGGIYFQGWSSETMMQTVSIADLQEEPLQSLWYLHIQPPAFDGMRAILAQIHAADDPMVTLQQVDRCLYAIWALV